MTSIFPPERTQQTFFPLKLNFLYISAATVEAAAPSVIILFFSRRVRIAEEISPSVTRTMSSTYSFTSSYVILPGVFTAIPSAIVDPPFTVKIFPSLTDSYMLGDIFVWTPIIFIFGFIFLAANAIPDISPPPPMGTTIMSRSGIFSSISSPIVPYA